MSPVRRVEEDASTLTEFEEEVEIIREGTVESTGALSRVVHITPYVAPEAMASRGGGGRDTHFMLALLI